MEIVLLVHSRASRFFLVHPGAANHIPRCMHSGTYLHFSSLPSKAITGYGGFVVFAWAWRYSL